MIPTSPSLHRHYWERFTFHAAPWGVPPAAAAEAASAAASAAHAPPPPPPGPPPPPHVHAHPAAPHGEYHAWRQYHRGFGRYRRGPSRLVWFGIGSLATLAYFKHKYGPMSWFHHHQQIENGAADGPFFACGRKPHDWSASSSASFPTHGGPDPATAAPSYPPMPAFLTPPAFEPAPQAASPPVAPSAAAAVTDNNSIPPPAVDANGRRFVPWSHRAREERREAGRQRAAEAQEKAARELELATATATSQEDQARKLAEARLDALLKSLTDLKLQLSADGPSAAAPAPTFAAQV